MNKIEGWKDVTLGMMETIEDIAQSHISEEDKTFKVAALLNGISFDDFLSLPLDDAQKMVADIGWLSQQPRKLKVKKKYTINNKVYKFMGDVSNLSVAQYIDFQALSKNSNMAISDLMAIVLIPDGYEYNECDREEVLEDIRTMKVEEALAVADFFTIRYERSIRRLLKKAKVVMEILKRSNKKDKELMEATALQISLITEELLSECGSHWWKRWPK